MTDESVKPATDEEIRAWRETAPHPNYAHQTIRRLITRIDAERAARRELRACLRRVQAIVDGAETGGTENEIIQPIVEAILAERAARERAERWIRDELSKPPQEREYCGGCSLPGEVARLREELARREG